MKYITLKRVTITWNSIDKIIIRGESILLINRIFDKAPLFAFNNCFEHIEDLFTMISINPDLGELNNSLNHNWEEDFETVRFYYCIILITYLAILSVWPFWYNSNSCKENNKSWIWYRCDFNTYSLENISDKGFKHGTHSDHSFSSSLKKDLRK